MYFKTYVKFNICILLSVILDQVVKQMEKALLYENHFDKDTGEFIMEGSGSYEIKDGKLYMDVTNPPRKGQTLWLNKVFEGDMYITYDAMVLEPFQACNINLFFMASTLNGDSVLHETHSGAYEEYHKTTRTYIMTFVGDNLKDGGTAGHTRLRKNPGFQLLSENTDVVSKMNVKYSFEIVKTKGDIECKIDGITVHKIVDAEPYNKGSIGFRTWNTRLWYDNLKVYSIREKD